MFIKPTTVGQLRREFLAHLERESFWGRLAPRTVCYYRHYTEKWEQAVGADLPLSQVIAYHLECTKTSWQSVQAVQRMFNFAVKVMGLLEQSPVAGVELPPLGERQLVLTRRERVQLLRRASHPFRDFLLGLIHTIARPGEVCSLRWSQLARFGNGLSAFVLTEFKGKARRTDGVQVRIVPVDARLARLLVRLRRRLESPQPRRRAKGQSWGLHWSALRGNYLKPSAPHDDFVFLNNWGRPWRSAGDAMYRLRKRCGIHDDPDRERVVNYTFRHTGATLATANGLEGQVLAALMGHANPKTTEHYQHLQPHDLISAIQVATRPR